MLSVTRERNTGRILLSTRGPFDDGTVQALLQAIALAPDNAPLVIDLFSTGTLHDDGIKVLTQALVARAGTVSFKHAGPWHRPILQAFPDVP